MDVGDVVFTDFHTLYKPTKHLQQNMLCIVYYATRKVKLIPPKEYQKADFANFWKGLKPGDDAVTPLNPIL